MNCRRRKNAGLKCFHLISGFPVIRKKGHCFLRLVILTIDNIVFFVNLDAFAGKIFELVSESNFIAGYLKSHQPNKFIENKWISLFTVTIFFLAFLILGAAKSFCEARKNWRVNEVFDKTRKIQPIAFLNLSFQALLEVFLALWECWATVPITEIVFVPALISLVCCYAFKKIYYPGRS